LDSGRKTENRLQEELYSKDEWSVPVAAKVMIPMMIDLFDPKSVVDVGCGYGMWLLQFDTLGIKDYVGVDGEWQRKRLVISPNHFVAHDLLEPLKLNRTFDLAICLETAEHLPDVAGRNLVRSLTELSSVVLFSAAIPFQPGTHHINEHWQNYWAEIFSDYRFVPIDAIRKRLWRNKNVEVVYIQNTLLYANKDELLKYPKLKRLSGETKIEELSVVHPKTYLSKCSMDFIPRELRTIRRILSSKAKVKGK
jgi:SAM-dependent methyltransferase